MTDSARSSDQGSDRNEPLSLFWALVLTVLGLLFLVSVAIILFSWLLTRHVPWSIPPPVGSSDPEFGLPGAIRYAFVAVAGLGGAVGLLVAYRRQRHLEVDAQGERDQTRLLTERFGAATAQLGHESPATRLAGVYALASLADEWTPETQPCIDVLCAYLRLPYTPEYRPGVMASAVTTVTREWKPEVLEEYYQDIEEVSTQVVRDVSTTRPGERQVRLSIIRVIASRLQPAAEPHWRGRDFDFTGAVFDGGSFAKSVFSGGRVIFDLTEWVGQDHVWFDDAEFSGATVSFDGAQFKGRSLRFEGIRVSGGTVRFDRSKFDGAGETSFVGANFEGGKVSFLQCSFRNGRLSFKDAVGLDTRVTFPKCRVGDSFRFILPDGNESEVPPEVGAANGSAAHDWDSAS